MAENGKSNNNRLQVCRVVDVPLHEVSGICVRRGRNGRMHLIAVGDRVAKVAWFSLPGSDGGRIDWHTSDIAKLSGSMLPKHAPQIEAVCADGPGRVLLLQETPPRVELIDPEALSVVASIDLEVEGRGEIAREWSEPKGSRGEGMVLLPDGHLLVAKEKKPAAFIEFGPPNSRSRGLVRGGALANGGRWPIKKGRHRFVALAIWLPDKILAKTCADFSDLEIGPDGRLYLLSDKSSTIARLDDLPPGGGAAALLDAWRPAIWMASRKVSHSPPRVVRSSRSTRASRAEISSCWSPRSPGCMAATRARVDPSIALIGPGSLIPLWVTRWILGRPDHLDQDGRVSEPGPAGRTLPYRHCWSTPAGPKVADNRDRDPTALIPISAQ